MKVALLRSPRNRNSIAVLHRVLRRSSLPGVCVEIVNAVPQDLGANDILAWSFTTIDLDTVASELQGLAGWSNRPLMVAGGAHPSADPEGSLALGFDAVFVGEAELTFPEFVAAWHDNPQRPLRDGERLIRPAQAYDLDQDPHADEDTTEFPFLEISRGCPYACAFCQVPTTFGRKMRFRGPATSAAGVACAVARGHRRIRCLTSDAFAYGGGPPAKVAASLEALVTACRGQGADYLMLGSFPSEVRPDRVETELLEVLRRHCANPTVVVGVQTGSDTVLRAMRRGHTVEESVRAVNLIGEAELVPHVDLLFGFPGETSADRLATLKLADWVLSLPRSRLHLHVYLPLPGTPAWPAEPEPLEPQIIAALRRLVATRRVDGYWDQQIAQGRRILAQRKSNLIHCS